MAAPRSPYGVAGAFLLFSYQARKGYLGRSGSRMEQRDDRTDHLRMVGAVLGMAAAAAAAVIALAGHAVGTDRPAAGTVSPFGGSVPVRLSHVGHIDVDLEAPAGSALRPVTCAGTSGAGTQCFVAP